MLPSLTIHGGPDELKSLLSDTMSQYFGARGTADQENVGLAAVMQPDGALPTGVSVGRSTYITKLISFEGAESPAML